MDSREREQKLIGRARRGDKDAFEALAAAHRRGLSAFIGRRLGARLRATTEVDDILQETYLKAFDSIDGFEWRGERSFFKWIATIAEYVIRGLGRTPRAGTLALEVDPAASGPSPSRAARREERFDRLEAALEALSEDHRTVIRLARIEGLPTSEVARRMSRSQGAVRHLLLRALESLRAGFGDDTESLNLPDGSFGRERGESCEP